MSDMVAEDYISGLRKVFTCLEHFAAELPQMLHNRLAETLEN